MSIRRWRSSEGKQTKRETASRRYRTKRRKSSLSLHRFFYKNVSKSKRNAEAESAGVGSYHRVTPTAEEERGVVNLLCSYHPRSTFLLSSYLTQYLTIFCHSSIEAGLYRRLYVTTIARDNNNLTCMNRQYSTFSSHIAYFKVVCLPLLISVFGG